MDTEMMRLLSLSGSYAALAVACTAALRPRLKLLPTMLLCAGIIIAGSLSSFGALPSMSHGRVIAALSSLGAVFLLFTDPVPIKISAICQLATLAVMVDATCWVAGVTIWHIPIAMAIHEVRWVDPVIPERILHIVLVVVLGAVWATFWRSSIRPLSQRTRNSLVVLLSAQAPSQAFLLSEIVANSTDQPLALPLTVLLLALTLASIVLLFAFFRIFGRGAAEEARDATMAYQLLVQTRFVQNLHAYAGNVTKLKSSVQETIESLRAALENDDEEALEVVLGEAASAQNRHTVPFSSSMAVSSLLSAKMADCETLGIRLLIRTRMNFVLLNEFDACTVLSNLLDNAIRAVRHCPAEDRWITVTISQHSGLLMLVCRNPYEAGHAKRRSPLEHGMGLNIVRQVAASYGGSLEISENDNVFTAVVSFYQSSGADEAPANA